MGHVKGFTETIFPSKALPGFTLFANIGLIFFMNLVGLELDFDLMVSEWKRTVIISVATMVVPFVVSIGSSVAVWQYIDKDYQQGKSFGTYMLFMYVDRRSVEKGDQELLVTLNDSCRSIYAFLASQALFLTFFDLLIV
jgi:hypothetical protein